MSIDWDQIAASVAERSLVESSEAGGFSLRESVTLWQQSVCELENAALWVLEDFEACFANRDDLDELLAGLAPSSLRNRLIQAVDDLDERFAALVVFSGLTPYRDASDQWWWATLPRRTDQRRFLADRWTREL